MQFGFETIWLIVESFSKRGLSYWGLFCTHTVKHLNTNILLYYISLKYVYKNVYVFTYVFLVKMYKINSTTHLTVQFVET